MFVNWALPSLAGDAPSTEYLSCRPAAPVGEAARHYGVDIMRANSDPQRQRSVLLAAVITGRLTGLPPVADLSGTIGREQWSESGWHRWVCSSTILWD